MTTRLNTDVAEFYRVVTVVKYLNGVQHTEIKGPYATLGTAKGVKTQYLNMVKSHKNSWGQQITPTKMVISCTIEKSVQVWEQVPLDED